MTKKDISEINQKIIAMYARGMTTRQISEQIEEIYDFECSESFISDVTDKILGIDANGMKDVISLQIGENESSKYWLGVLNELKNRDVKAKGEDKYPGAMKRREDNWDVITPIFKFSIDVRRVIYTTNAIESLNSTYKKLNRKRSVFPSDTALMKALYLSTLQATKKWTQNVRGWGKVFGEFSIMYPGRMPD